MPIIKIGKHLCCWEAWGLATQTWSNNPVVNEALLPPSSFLQDVARARCQRRGSGVEGWDGQPWLQGARDAARLLLAQDGHLQPRRHPAAGVPFLLSSFGRAA